jgi:hypothetical protein
MQTLIPSTTRLDDPTLIRLRVWAANLRDDGPPELTPPCRTLIHLIDVRGKLTAKNAVESVDRSIFMLVGQLVVCGASAPS